MNPATTASRPRRTVEVRTSSKAAQCFSGGRRCAGKGSTIGDCSFWELGRRWAIPLYGNRPHARPLDTIVVEKLCRVEKNVRTRAEG
eukprot:scaffold65789_cov21-Prasinocladus_malaysianus.AAC.2